MDPKVGPQRTPQVGTECLGASPGEASTLCLWKGLLIPPVLHWDGCCGCSCRASPYSKCLASRTQGEATAFRMGACNQPGQAHFCVFAMNIYAICAEPLCLVQ